MRIKEACALTGLTERAVRLYVSKGLCTPGQKGGYMDLSERDIRRLRDIGCLRRLGFSIEQIGRMCEEPERINEMLFERTAEAREAIGREQEALLALSGLKAESLRALVKQIEAHDPGFVPAGPDFARLDGDSAEERQRSEREARALRRIERRRRLTRRWAAAICMGAVLLLFAYILPTYLTFGTLDWAQSYGAIRLERRISLPTVSVLENDGDGYLLLNLLHTDKDEENDDRKLLRGIYTLKVRLSDETTELLPYINATGRRLHEPGTIMPEDCEPVLLLRVSVWDMLRAGCNPHPLNKYISDEEINDLLHALCRQSAYMRGDSLLLDHTALAKYMR